MTRTTMGEWQKSESGPTCFCGWPTIVTMNDDGTASLLCIGHTYEAGAIFPLPKERPEKWPNLSNEEMKTLIEQGIREHGENEDEDED